MFSPEKKDNLEHCRGHPPGRGIALINPSANKQISYGGGWSIYSVPGTSVSNQAEDYVPAQSNTAQQFPSGLAVLLCSLSLVGIFSFCTLFKTCCSDFRSYVTVSDAHMNDNYFSDFIFPEMLLALLFTETLEQK